MGTGRPGATRVLELPTERLLGDARHATLHRVTTETVEIISISLQRGSKFGLFQSGNRATHDRRGDKMAELKVRNGKTNLPQIEEIHQQA